MTPTTHPAVLVDDQLVRLVEDAEGRFTVKTWKAEWRRWVPGGPTPVTVLLAGTAPTLEDLRRLGLRRVPT
jgi:hypothetical protein